MHVALATMNWLAMLWTIAAAGRLEPRTASTPGERSHNAPTATAGAGAGAA